MFPLGHTHTVGYESCSKKTTFPGLPVCEKRVILRLLILTQYHLATDRQTDTPGISESLSSIAERDSKQLSYNRE